MRITIRSKKTKKGTRVLYLDFYENGRRWLEYLHVYLTGDRTHDKEAMRLAEIIRSKRQMDAAADSHGLQKPSSQDENFVDYCRKIGESKDKPNTRLVWKNAISQLEAFAGKVILFKRIDKTFLEGFRDHLLKGLKPNSAAVYLARIKTACRVGADELKLQRYPGSKVAIKKQDTRRIYLTIEELQKLAGTKCGNEAVRDAFLFSCFSGLRYSDVNALTWDKVKSQGKQTFLEFTQVKTAEIETLPIGTEAAIILAKQRNALRSGRVKISIAADAVFKMPAQQTTDKVLKRWAKAAGIEKNISFHTGRHTFATIGLKNGVDLYVMSKLLGHRSLESTQIYAKVVDESKRKAVAMFPTLTQAGQSRKSRRG